MFSHFVAAGEDASGAFMPEEGAGPGGGGWREAVGTCPKRVMV